MLRYISPRDFWKLVAIAIAVALLFKYM